MTTTELFAELLVIGVGAVCAVILVILAFSPDALQIVIGAPVVFVVPALALLYLVGILVDRIADYATESRLSKYLGVPNDEIDEKKRARNRLLDKNAIFRANWMYAKSRSRIVRGWMLNSLLLMISSFIYAYKSDCSNCGLLLALICGCVFALLGVLCGYVWRRMAKDELRAIDVWRALEEGKRV